MKGVIMHWTGGPHNVTALDKKHYHSIFPGAGGRVPGNLSREDNESTSDGIYAAHTHHMNTKFVGVAIACMGGAKWARLLKDVIFGKAPPTEIQVTEMCKWVAQLCHIYDIKVTRKTILTHGEVEKNLKIKQKGKWDINFLPWLPKGGNTFVGDYLRKRISEYLHYLENPVAEVLKPFTPAPEQIIVTKIPDTTIIALVGGACVAIGAAVSNWWDTMIGWIF